EEALRHPGQAIALRAECREPGRELRVRANALRPVEALLEELGGGSGVERLSLDGEDGPEPGDGRGRARREQGEGTLLGLVEVAALGEGPRDGRADPLDPDDRRE